MFTTQIHRTSIEHHGSVFQFAWQAGSERRLLRVIQKQVKSGLLLQVEADSLIDVVLGIMTNREEKLAKLGFKREKEKRW